MDYSNTLLKVCDSLEKHDIPYMIIGGQAVLYYGYPRFTEDIDITLGMEISDSQKILSILKEINCKALVNDPLDFIKSTWVLPVEEIVEKIKIDFTFSFSEYETQAIKNSILVSYENKKIHFCSVDDLIIHKIFAGRSRDLDDVKNIYFSNIDKLNIEYITKWLKEFNNTFNDSLGKDYVKLFNETIKK
ncbi:MAG: nucleotidyl transferase AbiEii/AbiGii toxin family protein [Ignavibacteria bacterium]|jgi:hypothetical protein|nr:nucleotidyl transferase AbiEii/AbiGii toxin family protein [Ignavibacteria bacterium]